MTPNPLIERRGDAERQLLESIVGRKLAGATVIFAFPGLGIGEIHNCLRGCTLETQLFQDMAEVYNPRGVDFFGVSSGRTPTVSSKVSYINFPKPTPPFTATCVAGEIFFSRETFAVLPQAVWKVSATMGVEEHLAMIKTLLP